jgi:hypothetical protein
MDEAASTPAPTVSNKIQARTLHDLSRFIGADPVFIDERIRELEREWTAERAFEAKAATAGILGVLLGLGLDRRFLAITGVASALLLQQSLQGWNPAQSALRRIGFRNAVEIHEEILALRILRGDFLERTDYPERALANARSWA